MKIQPGLQKAALLLKKTVQAGRLHYWPTICRYVIFLNDYQ